MSRVDQLPTLDSVNAKARACPKRFTKLARAIARKEKRLEDAKQFRIVGTKFFSKRGVRYIDARFPVRFEPT